MRITVEHFGPIVHADIEVKPLTLIIGREATGKSTLAKLV
jgi:predicted ATPase